ncbi:hypothetical protein [Sulfurihydrogenibium sp.]|uniref:hypothetical protein n=1 Tax=Sulfurihydrogenibium sp. TaxID=2053621 RepID=UPI00262AAB07|nr:hypothetical protein [Sulfurihydrogenibium sp.]
MKIVYFTIENFSKKTGITKKILSQVEIWRKLGMDVYLLAFSKGKASIKDEKFFNIVEENSVKLIFSLNINVVTLVNKINPNIIYFRYDAMPFSKTAFYLVNNYPTVVEVQTNDIDEFFLSWIKQNPNLKNIIKYILFRKNRDKFLSQTKALVTVTKELSELEIYKKFRKPMICIPNGIILDNYKILKNPNFYNDKIRFFFIGFGNVPWHGVDLIENIAKRMPEYEFHIVGLQKTSKLNNVIYYGFLDFSEYKKILEKCHICIGSLALHRNNMKEASPLKVREYLALGFPIIIGYTDTAFQNNLPDYVLQVDLTKEIITDEIIDKIKNFALKNKNRVVLHEEVKNFIDMEVLEEERIRFFKKIISVS